MKPWRPVMKVKWPRVRRAILEVTRPFLRLLGKAHVPPHYRSISKYEADAVINVIKRGDVLLSHRKRETTNFLIPGYWKHAAMYAGQGRVIEAIGKGVIETSIEEFCMTKDSVAVLRSKFSGVDVATLAVKYARDLRGLPYDYLVEHDHSRAVNIAFYCSEVIWWSYDQACLKIGLTSPFEPRMTMGVPTITPQDFENATKLWDEVLMVRGEQ
jgi:uncharacterized protein YycO